MNRRLLVLFIGALVVATPLVLFGLLGGGVDEPDAGPLSGPAGSMRRASDLPDTGPGAPARLAQGAAEAPRAADADDAPLDDVADLARYAHRDLPGRVVMADGGRVPAGLVLTATNERPSPAVLRLSDRIRNRDGDVDMRLVPPVAADAPDAAETPGAADGPDAAEAPAAPAADAPADAPAGAPAEVDGGARDAPRPKGDGIELSKARLAHLTRAEVAADGTFTLPHVPLNGGFVETADDLLYVDPPVRFEADTAFVEVRLERGAVLEGRVVDETGRPVPDARVLCAGRFDPWMAFDASARLVVLDETHADASGRLRVAPVPAGFALTLAALPAGGTLQPELVDVAPLHPGETRRVDVAVRRGGALAGRVVHADGSPYPSARVRVLRLDVSLRNVLIDEAREDEEELLVRTDASGAFRLGGLSDGSYRAVLVEDRYRHARTEDLDLRGGREVSGLELVAEEGLAVAGRVLGPDGAPREGVRLTLGRKPGMFDMGGALESKLERRTESDAEGRFRFTGLDEGTMRLQAAPQGAVPLQREVAAGTEDLELRLAETVSLSGIVISMRDSEPVTDFAVSLAPGGSFNFSDPTAWEERFQRSVGRKRFKHREDGTFSIHDLAPGSYTLTVDAEGYGALKQDVEVGADGRRGEVVLLPPEAQVVGRVVALATGRPVDGAEITTARRSMMEMIDQGMMGTAPSALSGADGRFALRNLPPGPIALTVRHADFLELGLPERALGLGESVDLGEVRLPAGGAVEGHVRDEQGRPAPGVTVLVSNATGTTMKRAASGPDGFYRVQGLPAGTFNVMRTDFTMDAGGKGGAMSFLKDMVMTTVTLAVDEVRTVDLQVRGSGGTRVYGTVSSRDGGAGGAMVSLVPVRGGLERMAFGSTGDDGSYALEGVRGGDYVLQVVLFEEGAMGGGGQPLSPVLQELTVAGEPELRRDVHLPDGVLHGRLESAADGAPVPDVRVLLHRIDAGRLSVGTYAALEGRVGEAQSKPDGSFRFRHLPAGTYELRAGGQNVLGQGDVGWAMTRVTDLSVDGEGPGFAVRVPLQRGGAIAGTVLDTAGRPLPGVSVWAQGPDGRWSSTFTELASDGSGRYQVSALSQGVWTLAFRDGSHALTLVRELVVRAGETLPLDVTLPPGVSLRLEGELVPWEVEVTLVSPEGPVPTGLVALTELLSQADEEGMVVGTFLPGPYQLRVSAQGRVLHDGQVVLPPGAGTYTVQVGAP